MEQLKENLRNVWSYCSSSSAWSAVVLAADWPTAAWHHPRSWLQVFCFLALCSTEENRNIWHAAATSYLMGWKTSKWPFVWNIGLFLCLPLRGWRAFCRQVFPLLSSLVTFSSLCFPSLPLPPRRSRPPQPRLPLLFIPPSLLLFLSFSLSTSQSPSSYRSL